MLYSVISASTDSDVNLKPTIKTKIHPLADMDCKLDCASSWELDEQDEYKQKAAADFQDGIFKGDGSYCCILCDRASSRPDVFVFIHPNDNTIIETFGVCGSCVTEASNSFSKTPVFDFHKRCAQAIKKWYGIETTQ